MEETPREYPPTSIKILQDLEKSKEHEYHGVNIALRNYNRFVKEVLSRKRGPCDEESVREILNNLGITLQDWELSGIVAKEPSCI